MIALFARADHPAGWTQPAAVGYFDDGKWTREQDGMGAHGYSIIAVTEIGNVDQLHAVKMRLQQRFNKPDEWRETKLSSGVKRMYPWYGGYFDFLGLIRTTTPYAQLAVENMYGQTRQFNSYGDNRFFGIYTAEEVLTG